MLTYGCSMSNVECSIISKAEALEKVTVFVNEELKERRYWGANGDDHFFPQFSGDFWMNIELIDGRWVASHTAGVTAGFYIIASIDKYGENAKLEKVGFSSD
jgi:hypothetical protein